MPAQNYIPLTERYRPKLLEDFIGQDNVVAQVRGMLASGRLHHTLMLHGSYGSGKTSMAYTIARYVNCLNPINGYEPCGQCWSCQQDPKNHDDVVEINGTLDRGVDYHRQLAECVNLSPQSNYRIYIFDEIQGLTKEAISLWLKPFEQPNPKTIFILCTTDPHKIPETIRSRCMSLPIIPVENETCANWLKSVAEREGLSGTEIDLYRQIAERVKNHPRSALQALEATINWICGNPGKDISTDILSGVIETSVKLPPEQMAAKWIASVLSGQFSSALIVAKAVEDPVWFCGLLCNYVTATFGKFINKDLLDPSYNYFYKKLDELLAQIQQNLPYWKPPLPTHLAFILETLTKAYSDQKTYIADNGRPLLLAATMRCVSHMTSYMQWLQQNQATSAQKG